MAVKKIVRIGEQEIPMRASALVPRLYRVKFGRDMIGDLRQLERKLKKAGKGDDAEFDALELTIFEDVAWMLAKHADSTVPDDPDDWLDSIEGVFSIYLALPQILELWGLNQAQTSVPAKK